MSCKGAVHRGLICVVFCLFGVRHGDRSKVRLAGVFVGLRDPRQAKKVEHDLVEMRVVAVCAVLVGADDFMEIEEWANEKVGWLRQYLKLEKGIPSHDTFGRVPHQAQRWPQGTSTHRRYLGQLSRSTSRSCIGFMRLPCRRAAHAGKKCRKQVKFLIHVVPCGSTSPDGCDMRPGGGIGRRTRFRFWRREAWGFESLPGHQRAGADSGGLTGNPVAVWRGLILCGFSMFFQ